MDYSFFIHIHTEYFINYLSQLIELCLRVYATAKKKKKQVTAEKVYTLSPPF